MITSECNIRTGKHTYACMPWPAAETGWLAVYPQWDGADGFVGDRAKEPGRPSRPATDAEVDAAMVAGTYDRQVPA